MSLKVLSNIRYCWSAVGSLAEQVLSRNVVSHRYKMQVLSTCTYCQNNKLLFDDNKQLIYKQHVPSSEYTTTATSTGSPGMMRRLMTRLGFPGKMRYKKYLLKRAGLRLYLCCAELIDHEQFFKELGLPDTYNSWFRLTELHVWMMMVRLSSEQREGVYVRNNMISFLWEDMHKKAKKLGGDTTMTIKGVQLLTEQFKGMLISYDEGLMDADRVLAGALWRGVFEGQCDDIEKLELLVQYVRKQISHLDKQESGVILTSGLVTFLPLRGDEEDNTRNNFILKEILKRV